MIRYTKPFNSARIKVEDVGNNLGMTPFYYKNGTVYSDPNTGVFNSTILSPRLVPALRYIQIVKFLVDSSFSNINDPNQDLYGPANYNKAGARAECWFRTAANQNV